MPDDIVNDRQLKHSIATPIMVTGKALPKIAAKRGHVRSNWLMNGDLPTPSAKGDDAVAALSYSFKPSFLSVPWEFALAADALEWRAGRRSGRLPYAAIRRVRLSFRPASMQMQRFRTEIWSDGSPKLSIVSSSGKGLLEQMHQGPAYARFVVELHRRLAALGRGVRCETGMFAPLYWCGFALFAACTLAMSALVVRALQTQAWSGAAFIAVVLAVFCWQAGNYFRRNRPGVYPPDAPPALLLPRP